MEKNTLSSRQDLYQLQANTEGLPNRTLTLLLLTNKKSAYQAINQARFTRETREFGSGYYFIEKFEESELFDIPDKAIVACTVCLGVSLILTSPDQNITEKFLKSKSCNSVKGYLSLSQKYYIVYNYKQIEKVIAIKAEESIVRSYEVYRKCTNYLCKFHGQEHYDRCSLMCYEKNCRFFNGFHIPPCDLKCADVSCEKFNSFHNDECKLRCKWENCVMFGKFHECKCIHLEHEKEVEASQEDVYYKTKFSGVIETKTNKKKKKNNSGLEKVKKLAPAVKLFSTFDQNFPSMSGGQSAKKDAKVTVWDKVSEQMKKENENELKRKKAEQEKNFKAEIKHQDFRKEIKRVDNKGFNCNTGVARNQGFEGFKGNKSRFENEGQFDYYHDNLPLTEKDKNYFDGVARNMEYLDGYHLPKVKILKRKENLFWTGIKSLFNSKYSLALLGVSLITGIGIFKFYFKF